MMRKISALLGLCLSLTLLVPGAVFAQSAPKKKKVIRLDALTVEGRIQKPQAFYILQRSNLNFDELSNSEHFTPKIVKSLDKEPF